MSNVSLCVVPREEQSLPLREVALWYPRVPEPELCLNEASFTGENPCITGYQPLFWIHFGGPSGNFLKHITGISVHSICRLDSVEFHYDAIHDGAGEFKLGRHAPPDNSHVRRFAIDGAGGEIIETVQVALQRSDDENAYGFMKHGELMSIKVKLLLTPLLSLEEFQSSTRVSLCSR